MEDRFTAEAIAADIFTYTELGDHRTGWPADDDASEWLAATLRAAGLDSEQVPFTFPLVQPEPSWVELGGRRVPGAPLYDGGVTSPEGVSGRLTDVTTAADERLLVLRDAPIAAHGHREPWGDARPAGVIQISGDPEGAVLYRNAERIDRPFAVPVLQVARRDADPIEEAISAGGDATLVVRAQRAPGTATNVVATLPATIGTPGPANNAIVLMTPKSGWGPCAAERGGGIAIELALARHLAALPERRREVRCLFTAGHELAHYGLCSLLRDQPARSSGVTLWVHLGASIGAKLPQPSRMFASDERARAALLAAFAAEGAAPFESQAPGVIPGGEARELLDRPYVSLAGQHAYFHSDNDTFEKAADAERVARFGRAFRRLVEPLVVGAD